MSERYTDLQACRDALGELLAEHGVMVRGLEELHAPFGREPRRVCRECGKVYPCPTMVIVNDPEPV